MSDKPDISEQEFEDALQHLLIRHLRVELARGNLYPSDELEFNSAREKVVAAYRRLGEQLQQAQAEIERLTPKKREHVWQFYMNGTFCTRCGAAVGTEWECKP